MRYIAMLQVEIININGFGVHRGHSYFTKNCTTTFKEMTFFATVTVDKLKKL